MCCASDRFSILFVNKEIASSHVISSACCHRYVAVEVSNIADGHNSLGKVYRSRYNGLNSHKLAHGDLLCLG